MIFNKSTSVGALIPDLGKLRLYQPSVLDLKATQLTKHWSSGGDFGITTECSVPSMSQLFTGLKTEMKGAIMPSFFLSPPAMVQFKTSSRNPLKLAKVKTRAY